jgi:hypothetical protein
MTKYEVIFDDMLDRYSFHTSPELGEILKEILAIAHQKQKEEPK